MAEPSSSGVSGVAFVASYAGLVCVNTIAGKGLWGMKTNREVSAAYPVEIIPVGKTFAIWGPIFLLQGAGTALLASSGMSGPYAAAAVPWLVTWAAESAWQCVFWTAPVPSDAASVPRKSLTLLPSAALLMTGHAAIMAAGAALRDAPGNRSILGALLIDLPTGLNAGWMAAASGIGITIAAKHGPAVLRGLSTPSGGAGLVYALSAYGVAASVLLAAPQSLLVSLGYSAATAWACNGIAERPNVDPQVKKAARHGVWISAAGAALAVAACVGIAFRSTEA